MKRLPCALWLLVCLVGPCSLALSWEIELDDHVATRAALVRLGDVARVTGLADADRQALERVVLAPGPSRSYSRSLSASQIRTVLARRGVELTDCQLTGAFRAIIQYDAAAQAATGSRTTAYRASPRNLVRPASYRSTGGVALVHGVQDKLAEAVRGRLAELSADDVPWDVAITIPGRALGALPPDWNAVQLEGLDAATEGQLQLVACFVTAEGDTRIPVQATATRMVQLAVPVRDLQRGAIVQAADVETRYITFDQDRRQMAQRADDVVGRQVQLALQAGRPVPLSSLKKPILVKRREEVEVVARRGGITIRTKVRSLDDGALGDVVAVEKLDDSKERFVARVTGVQQVAVCVTGAVVTPNTGR